MTGPSGSTPNLQLPYPLPGDTVDVPRDIQALATKIDGYLAIPVGALLMWPTNAPPAGFLVCNGQTVPASSYPQLEAILGQSGGNITLPDYRDRFPVGAGPTMALGTAGGAASVPLVPGNLPKHTHSDGTLVTDTELNHTHNILEAAAAGASWGNTNAIYAPHSGTLNGQTVVSQGGGQHAHDVTGNTGDGGAALAATAHENRPPYRAINFIIRAA